MNKLWFVDVGWGDGSHESLVAYASPEDARVAAETHATVRRRGGPSYMPCDHITIIGPVSPGVDLVTAPREVVYAVRGAL